MIYLSLPNFYANYRICKFFYWLCKAHPECLRIPVVVSSVYGSFPYCYWNGGCNNNTGKGAYYNDFIGITDQVPAPIRFNCSNINLGKLDYDNVMANLILKSADNGANWIELSNLELCEKLAKEYPDYKFIFSKEAEYAYPNLTPELFNEIIDQNIFSLIGVPESKAHDLEFLSQIKKKSLLEVPINTSCNHNCAKYKTCKIHEHNAQYDFSGMNNFEACLDNIGYHFYAPQVTIEDIVNTYLPMGITHFSIADIIESKKNSLLTFLINYFVKDEMQYTVLQEFIGGMN